MISSRTLKIATAATALLSAHFAYSVSLKDLTQGYDVFVEEDTNLGGVRIHGSIATGNDLNLYGNKSSFDDDNKSTSKYQVVAGNVLDLQTNGQINGDKGLLRVGDASGQTVSGNRLNQSGGSFLEMKSGQSISSITSSNEVDFSTFSTIKGISASLRAMAPTLALPIVGSDLILDFTASTGLEIINISPADFDSFGQIKEAAGSALSSGARFVFNVDLTGFTEVFGKTLSKPWGINHNMDTILASEGVLWNFYGADTLKLDSNWRGSILAADIDVVDDSSGDIFGAVIAESFKKAGGEVHPGSFDYDFNFDVPDSGSTAFLFLLSIPAFVALRRRMK